MLNKTKHHLKLLLLAGDTLYMILSFDVIINSYSQMLLSTLKALLVGYGEVIVVLHHFQQSFSYITPARLPSG